MPRIRTTGLEFAFPIWEYPIAEGTIHKFIPHPDQDTKAGLPITPRTQVVKAQSFPENS